MPMTAPGLAAVIEAQLGVADPQSSAQILLLATAIVTYIQTNAVVSVVNTVPSLGLVAPVGGGPVTGAVVGSTGTGTIA